MTVRGCGLVFAVASLVFGGVAGADQPPLLNLDNGSGGSYLTGAAATGAQMVQLDAVQRGVTASGATRVPSPFGWALNADPTAVDEVGTRMFGPVDLVTGGVSYSDTQLVLPAYAPWPIGVSYNSAQTGSYVGSGYQGNNWFQVSQPAVTQVDSDGIVRLFYAANAFVEYKRVDSTNYCVGINGAGGVLILETATVHGSPSETTPVYRLLDQTGTEVVFFGFDSGLYTNGAAGQVWKYTVCKGTKTGTTDQTAYVGHATLPRTAANSGYASGHIVYAYDSAGRKFEYSYESIGGSDRLTSVVAKAAGGSPVIARVDYAYYGDSGITTPVINNSTTNNGAAGDLALVRVTLPTSFPAAGSDPAIEDIRENRFYYDTDSRVKLVLGYEGTRRHLVAAGSSPVSWDANATTLGTALNSRAELRVAYSTTTGMTGKVASAWFAGMDGTNDQPSGEHVFAYEDRGTYTTPWQWRTIVKLPEFSRYADSTLSDTSPETAGNVWMTQYLDVLGQPLHTVTSDIDPASTGSTPKYWVTGVVRDSKYRLQAVHTPANCSGYNHNATSASRGSYTTSSTAGLVTYYERYGTTSDFEGMVYGYRRGAGTGTAYGGTNYVTWSDHEMREVELNASPKVELRRPVTRHTRVFPGVTTSPTGGSYTSTEYNYTWWTGAADTLVARTIETVLPAVSTSNNGSGTSNTRKSYFNRLGQPIVHRLPNGRLDASEYDATTGVLVKQITDTSTPSYADLPSGEPTQATFAGESTPYNLTTEYAHDELGRIVQTKANTQSGGTAHTSLSFYSRLSDRRLVRLDVPTAVIGSPTTYYGPISASVVNHIGVVEEGGLISPANPTVVQDTSNPSRFSTTSAPRLWLEEPGTTLLQSRLTKAQAGHLASGSPALVTYSMSKLSLDGSRRVELRRYNSVPTSAGTGGDWLGVVDTNYDRSLTRYNPMGLVDRAEDATNTIDSFGFDVLGRVVRHSRGTVDSGTTPPQNMRWVSTMVYDSTSYGGTSAADINVAGTNGQVTQVWEHPSGTLGGAGDSHSHIRYDGLGNAIHYWGDNGPYLASAVDNLGRVTKAAAFDATYSAWNTAGPSNPDVDNAASSGPAQLRKRYAECNYDELGRVFRQSQFAVNPADGTKAGTTADIFQSNTVYGKNGTVKYVSSTGGDTQMSHDRVCQTHTVAVVAPNWPTGTTSAQVYNAVTGGDYSNHVVIAQTNTYRDNNHQMVVATVAAQRGTPDVSEYGGVITGSPPSLRGLLMDVPYSSGTTGQGWWDVQHTPSTGLLLMPEPTFAPSYLITSTRTREYDGLLLMPRMDRFIGDVLRHPTPRPDEICCGVGCADPFIDSGTWPYVETEYQVDPRRIICRTTTTDWETGERSVQARLVNAGGQPVRSMAVKRHVNPLTGLPTKPDYTQPLVPTNDCCERADRTDWEWSKGRLKLEKMFICDPPADGDFNPLSDDITEWCQNSSCPKVTSYGYPDMQGLETMFPPDFLTTPPNDNNLPLWALKPIGESPDLAWTQAAEDGEDDADWYVYDYLGRKKKVYNHIYRNGEFGDGNKVNDYPFEETIRLPGGYPTEIIKPSGKAAKPFDHQIIGYDYLGRPKYIKHVLDDYTLGSGWTPDDEIELSYDKYGMLSEYKQRFKGMFPSGCGPSGDWIICGIERGGTPQQSVTLGGNPLTPWQGPRVLGTSLPGGRVLGMAYFPNPAGTSDTTMYPSGAAGSGGLLMEPRIDWALGRTRGVFHGDSTDPFETPVAMYDNVGLNMALRRSLPGVGGGYEKWQMLPTHYVPMKDGTPGTLTMPERMAPDWRWRYRDDIFNPIIDSLPATIPPNLFAPAEGHKDIIWVGSKIASYLDPATTPNFGVDSGGMPLPSPVNDFDIHGHDELYRHDCNGKPIYWLSGQLPAMTAGSSSAHKDVENAWAAGRADLASTTKNGAGSAAAALTGIYELEMRWPDQPGSCDTTGGNGGWLISPRGKLNQDHPLFPRSPDSLTEWGNNLPHPLEGGCAQNPNSRTGLGQRWLTPSGGGTPTQPSGLGWPFKHTYDAAGNLRTDRRNWYVYDGSNRLTEVYRVWFDAIGDPHKGTLAAGFEYDGLGRHLKSTYDTDGDGDLSNEDTEWTPRDVLGRPIGIWRHKPVTSEDPTPCAEPYQLFGYHSTGLRGTGYDATGGILDCPAVRWRDADGDPETGVDGMEETLHYLQDFRGDVTALADGDGIVERVRYGMAGRPESFPVADVNFDGVVDAEDDDSFTKALDAFDQDPADYDPRADLNRDGSVDGKDENIFLASYGAMGGQSGNWKLSSGTGLTAGKQAADGLDNRFGWRGYWYDKATQLYHVRHRVYDPREGRWMQNDPLGFGAGDQDLYRYCGGNYSTGYDPLGLDEPDGTSAAPFVINPGERDTLREVLRRVNAGEPQVHVVIWRLAPGAITTTRIDGYFDNTQGGIFVPTSGPGAINAPQIYQEALDQAMRNGSALARDMRVAVETSVIVLGVAVTLVIPGPEDAVFLALASKYGLKALAKAGHQLFGIGKNGEKIALAADDIKKAERSLEQAKEAAAAEKKSAEGCSDANSAARAVDDAQAAARKWKPTEFNGTRVYQRNELIDPNRVDDLGRTNVERMDEGIAPLGPDGESINLHHSLQSNDSPIYELSATFHRENSAVIHINPNTIPSGIDRDAFKRWKRQYWQNRANDFR